MWEGVSNMYLTPGLFRHVLSMNYHLQIPAGLAEDLISASLPSAPRSSPPRWHPEQCLRFLSNPSDNWHVACCLLNTVKFIRMKSLFFSAVLHVSVRACTCTLTPFIPLSAEVNAALMLNCPLQWDHTSTHMLQGFCCQQWVLLDSKAAFSKAAYYICFHIFTFHLETRVEQPCVINYPKKRRALAALCDITTGSFPQPCGFFLKVEQAREAKTFPLSGGVQWQAADALLQHISEAHLTRGPWRWRCQSTRRQFLQKRDAEMSLRDFFLRVLWWLGLQELVWKMVCSIDCWKAVGCCH